MERQKRLVKKSRKALEAAEMERIFLQQVNLKKRKGCPKSLLDKPEACNVSVASELGWEQSLRKSSEMATDRKKEGKENEAPMKLSFLINMPYVIEGGGTDSKCQVAKSHVMLIKRQKYELAEAENKCCFRSLVDSESASYVPKMTKLTGAEENQNCLVHSQIEGIEGDKMLGNHVPEVGLTKSYCIIKENRYTSCVPCHRKLC